MIRINNNLICDLFYFIIKILVKATVSCLLDDVHCTVPWDSRRVVDPAAAQSAATQILTEKPNLNTRAQSADGAARRSDVLDPSPVRPSLSSSVHRHGPTTLPDTSQFCINVLVDITENYIFTLLWLLFIFNFQNCWVHLTSRFVLIYKNTAYTPPPSPPLIIEITVVYHLDIQRNVNYKKRNNWAL